MTTPALVRLREAHPQAHITLLTVEKLADLWRQHPAVDEILTFAPTDTVWKRAKRIRSGGFGAGLILPNSDRSAVELWLGGVPRRTGFATPLRRLLLTQVVARPSSFVKMRKRSAGEVRRMISNPGPELRSFARTSDTSAHHIHHYLKLIAALGGNPEPLPPLLNVPDAEVLEVAERLIGCGGKSPGRFEPNQPSLWFGLNPGAEYGPAKRWPKENFTAAAQEISRLTGCHWYLLGGAADIPLASEIASGIGGDVRNLAGKTSLRELMALLRFGRVLLTNDTGPMHLAAAVGTPVVAVFGSTSPELTAPGLPSDPRHRLLAARVPCSPCFRRECPIDLRCMSQVKIPSVVQAVLDVYRRTPCGK